MRMKRPNSRGGWSSNASVFIGFSGGPVLLLLAQLYFSCLLAADALWTPGPGVSWQWQITGTLDLSVDVDMFNLDLFDVTEDQVASLRDRGVIVICSFSAGTFEVSATDFGNVSSSAYGELVTTADSEERWLDVTREDVLLVMEGRMDLAVNKSCDGVDPSNVQVFNVEGTGLNITAEEQITYNMWLAGQAHDRNLSIGLRNDWTQLADLVGSFDWALSENCLAEGECESYQGNFVLAEKAVLDAELFQFDVSFCANVTASGLDVIIKDPSLDERRCSCQNPSTDIECDTLLNQNATTLSDGQSYWVIAVAVGASIFILVAAAVIVMWQRDKQGDIRGVSASSHGVGVGRR